MYVLLTLVLYMLALCSVPSVSAQADDESEDKTETGKEEEMSVIDMNVEFPKSVFVDDFRKGADPFFPNSVRRLPASEKAADTEKPKPPPSTALKLRGIFMVEGEPARALINDKIVTIGFEGNVRTEEGELHIKCSDIRESSIVLEVEGESIPVELSIYE
ncbi:MAG: hypothetical protein K9N48_08090 [Verrucomicrobia bacterium]|nr:hypothetical protein [Verrucomicrobiota bacterium]MCF7707889.1 hypothetical protein [Verrucomicrobiota bacterium]